MTSDYIRFRGRCKELVDAAIQIDPTLTAVRGFYFCPIWWTRDQHWWAVKPDGTIVDPSALQFPSRGYGIYEPFDGVVECAQCGKEMNEGAAWRLEGRYAYCSYTCYGRFVGVL